MSQDYTQVGSMFMGDAGSAPQSQSTPRIFIFSTHNQRANSFLSSPFLPLKIASESDKYSNIQLVTILSIADGSDACPFYNAVHSEQLMNASTMAQNQAENSLDFDIPADHSDAQYVVNGNLAGFFDLDDKFQLFKIVKVENDHDDTLYKVVTCQHVGTGLANEYIEYLNLEQAEAKAALSAVLDGTLWQVGNVDNLGVHNLVVKRSNIVATFLVLMQTWGGEMSYRVEFSGSRITGLFVDWVQQRGTDSGKRFVYGKDMIKVQKTDDAENVYTALYGYGQQDANGDPLTFASIEWSIANGDPVDKPAGQTWVGDPGALATWGEANGTQHLRGIFSDGNYTNAENLLQATYEKLQSLKTPLVSYDMSVVDLERIAGYSHEKARIGDTVAIIDTDFEPPLRLKGRILQPNRNLTEADKTTVTIGNYLPSTYQQDLTISNLQSSVSDIQAGTVQKGQPIDAGHLQGTIDMLKAELANNNAYVYTSKTDGILVLDAPIDQNPTAALKFGGGIFGIADSKLPDGSWNWSEFGTGAGFVADLITTGTLIGVAVKLGGQNNGNGTLEVEDDTGTTWLTIANKAITLSNGATMIGGSGVLSTLTFQSSGQYEGWQQVGAWNNGGSTSDVQAMLTGYIPSNFTIVSATLYTKIMSAYDPSTTTWYSLTQGRLYKGQNSSGTLNWPPASEWWISLGGMTEITSSAWGGQWSPTAGSAIQTKSCDVRSYLSPGNRFAFMADSAANLSTAPGISGLVQFDLVVIGYTNG